MTYVNMIKPELARRYAASGLWTNKTFFELLEERAAAHPEREVFADAKRRIGYGALKDEILRCAEFYRRIGIKRGDVVTVQLPSIPEFVVIYHAAARLGAVFSTLHMPTDAARSSRYCGTPRRAWCFARPPMTNPIHPACLSDWQSNS